jgi:hypothetical protein
MIRIVPSVSRIFTPSLLTLLLGAQGFEPCTIERDLPYAFRFRALLALFAVNLVARLPDDCHAAVEVHSRPLKTTSFAAPAASGKTEYQCVGVFCLCERL